MTSTYRSVDNDIARQALVNRGHLILESCALNSTRLRLPHHEAPEVSIIIVSYNAPELLAITLTSLLAHLATIDAKCELIIIDNASGERTRSFLQRVNGAHIHFLERNVGFGPACNMGASLASGDILLFMNPDIEMAPGCIDALMACMRSRKTVGAVGGRLVFPGGRLQEAGAGFINDAQLTHPYERGNPFPCAPEAMFRRPSGYVSGALLLVRRDLFSSLKGFDRAFAPAYFEDTDLCLRIWKSDH
jgi:GT2 family glycosyltransferase